jgi:hypothetical protein
MFLLRAEYNSLQIDLSNILVMQGLSHKEREIEH